MSEKKRRRRSAASLSVKTEDTAELEQDETLKELYTNKNAAIPSPKAIETIFEERHDNDEDKAEDRKRPRRGQNGAEQTWALGKNKSMRMIEPSKFWVEDKKKTQHRAKMSRKAFKGARRMKLTALTEGQEAQLIKMIEEKENTEDEESPVKATKGGKRTIKTPQVSKTPFKTPKATKTPLKTPTTSKTPLKTPGSLRTSARKLSKTPSSSKTPTTHGRTLTYAPGESSSFNVEGANVSQEELRRQIEEADSAFGVVAYQDDVEEDEDASTSSSTAPKAAKTKGSNRRDSVTVRVRRSSRLMNLGANFKPGSIYRCAEFDAKKIRKRPTDTDDDESESDQ